MREHKHRVSEEFNLRRFWKHVSQAGEDECWTWIGPYSVTGYAQYNAHCRHYRASHKMLQLSGRERPSADYVACHTCDNPKCVNPKHLWWGTSKDNMQDCVNKGRNYRKLAPESIPGIRARLAAGEKYSWIAKDYNISAKVISDIGKGIIWRGQ